MDTDCTDVGYLLKEPGGSYIVFIGTVKERDEYLSWYRAANGGKELKRKCSGDTFIIRPKS